MNNFEADNINNNTSMLHLVNYIYDNLNDSEHMPSVSGIYSSTSLSVDEIMDLIDRLFDMGIISRCNDNETHKVLKTKLETLSLIGINTDNVVGKIYETYDYDKFSYLKWNRTVNLNHVERIKKSILKQKFLDPIVVSQDFYVLDGQHRIAAYKSLGLPIKYIIDNTPDNYRNLVITRNSFLEKWKTTDYVHAYAKDGNSEYAKFVEFMNEFKEFKTIRMFSMLLIKSGSTERHSKILTGNIEIQNIDTSRRIANLMIDIRMKQAFTINKLDICRNYKLFQAVIWLMKKDVYDHKRFTLQLDKYPTKVYPCVNVEQYRNMLVNLYNYNQRDRLPI